MQKIVRIGNAHGFWGDRLEAAAEMLLLEPDLDFLTLDFLAEVSMSILAIQRQRDPSSGYAHDFIDIVESLTPYWQRGGRCRVITNAGGLNPLGCALACQKILQQAGCGDLTIAVVSGDDVLDQVRDNSESQTQDTANLDTGASIETVMDRLTTANAYLGAQPIAEALRRGADLVITGRVADPSLTVGACLYHFGWSETEFDRIAGATIAGHLIECGTQVTGGISTEWLCVPNLSWIGFPIVEVEEDGSCFVTKPNGSGGWVTESTVKEQLLYEIGNPGDYLSPDARVSFLSLEVRQESRDRIRVSGAKGQPPSPFYKVSATFQNGYRAAGELTIYGSDALEKAQRAAGIVLEGLEQSGVTFQNQWVETLGAGSCDRWRRLVPPHPVSEVVVRIAVADPNLESVKQFTKALMPLITAGPPGTTGYAEGRPRVHPQIGYWPCLIRRDRVRPEVQIIPAVKNHATSTAPRGRIVPRRKPTDLSARPLEAPIVRPLTGTLSDIALARSGDKGRDANIGVIARQPEDFSRLQSELSVERVASHFGINPIDRVSRYELPKLAALNFIIRGILDNPLCIDPQGKTLGQVLLQIPLSTSQPSEE